MRALMNNAAAYWQVVYCAVFVTYWRVTEIVRNRSLKTSRLGTWRFNYADYVAGLPRMYGAYGPGLERLDRWAESALKA